MDERYFTVWEVRDGISGCYCETPEDAQMVANEYRRRNAVIDVHETVTIAQCEVSGIDEGSRRFVEHLRKRLQLRD